MAKMKQAANVKVGSKVVVNDLPDGTVYTVSSYHPAVCELTYTEGGVTYSGGTYPTISLLEPTKEQLLNALK